MKRRRKGINIKERVVYFKQDTMRKLEEMIKIYDTNRSNMVTHIMEYAKENIEDIMEYYHDNYETLRPNYKPIQAQTSTTRLVNITVELNKWYEKELKTRVDSFAIFIRTIVDYFYNKEVKPNEEKIQKTLKLLKEKGIKVKGATIKDGQVNVVIDDEE